MSELDEDTIGLGIEEPKQSGSMELDEQIESGSDDPIDMSLDEESSGAKPTITAETHIDGGSSVSEVNTAGTINQYNFDEFSNTSENGYQVKKALRHKYFQLISLPVLENETKALVIEKNLLNRCLKILGTHRILLICGEPRVGKSSLALSLAKALINQCDVSGLEVRKKKILEEHFRSHLSDICSDKKLLKNQILIFSDPFVSVNNDLAKGNALDDKAVLGSLISQLKEANAYLIFTADQESVNTRWQQMKFIEQMELPSKAHLVEFLNQQLIQHKNFTLDASVQSQLLEHIDTLPKIASFSERFFPRLAEGSLALDEALARYLHKDNRFLQDVHERSEASWRLCLAVLLLINYSSRNVSSLLAHSLAETLRVYFDSLNTPKPESYSTPYLLSDKDLLSVARLEYHLGSNSAEPLLRFTESSFPAQLWQSLMLNGHSLLAVLRPLLEDLLKNRDSEHAGMAAAALGRIGGLSPSDVVYPLIIRESRRKPEQAYKLLAALFTGISECDDTDYLVSSLRFLKIQCQTKEYVITYMLVLRELGLQRPELALKLILEISQHVLGKKLNDFERLWSAIDQQVNITQKIVNKSNFQTGSSKEKRHAKEGLFKQVVNSELFTAFEKETFFAGSFALAGLSFGLGTVQLANKILITLRQNFETAKPLIALYWLCYVFEKMSENPLVVDIAGNGRSVKTDRTVWEMIENPEQLAGFAHFLLMLDESLKEYPPVIADDLRTMLVGYVKAWITHGVKTESGERAVTSLLMQLSKRPNSQLWKAILDMLTFDQDFLVKGTPLSNLAIDIITNRGS